MPDFAVPYTYALYNTATEQVEATEHMTDAERLNRNVKLRSYGEPQRWVALEEVE